MKTNVSNNYQLKISSQNSEYSPLISIITVIFNSKNSLEQTIKSVINQSYEHVEYIIIDGGSTDGTLDIIKQYEKNLAYWISESDRGIYDAMNKGITVAKGKIIGILNSGDLYNQDALKKVAKLYDNNQQNEYLIITGAMTRFDNDTKIEFIQKRSLTDLRRRINLGMPINHPATFVTKNIYETIGCFNPKYKIGGDYDFIFRAYHSQIVQFIFTDDILAAMSMGGVSEKSTNLWIRAREAIKIRKAKLSIVHNILLALRLIFIGYTKHLLVAIMGQKAVLIKHQIGHETTNLVGLTDNRENLSF